MYCNKCGNQLNSDDSFCTKCGTKTENISQKNMKLKSVNHKKIILVSVISGILLLGCTAFGITTFLHNRESEYLKQSARDAIESENFFNSSNSNSNYNKNSNNELSAKEKMMQKLATLIEQKQYVFDTGNYIAGEIPVGEYAFIKFDGSGTYYSEEDAGGNIIDNENFDSFGYVKVHGLGNLTTQGLLVNINAFKQLEISGAKELYEILNDQYNYNQGGYYKVGVDIEPGKYTIESIGSGYYAILTGPLSNNDIINNDNFNGKVIVNVKKGQYLQTSRAIIK